MHPLLRLLACAALSTAVISAACGGGASEEADLHVMMNMEGQDLNFDLPAVPGRTWYRALDTTQPSPDDFPDNPVAVDGTVYNVKSHGVVVLVSKDTAESKPRSSAAKPRRRKESSTQ